MIDSFDSYSLEGVQCYALSVEDPGKTLLEEEAPLKILMQTGVLCGGSEDVQWLLPQLWAQTGFSHDLFPSASLQPSHSVRGMRTGIIIPRHALCIHATMLMVSSSTCTLDGADILHPSDEQLQDHL